MSIISVAREYGSGGKDIAKIIAERLGYDCVDKELIAEIAHTAGVSVAIVEQMDEVGETTIRRFLSELFTPSTVYSLSPEYPPLIWPYVPGDDEGTKDPTSLKNTFLDRGEYLQILQDTIRSLADRTNTIIVGRGSQCILSESKTVFHTRFIAPFEYRVDVIMDEMNLSRDRATELIREKDRQRALYLKHNYQRDWTDATLYHMVFNTSRTSWENMADIVIDAHRKLFGDDG